MKAALCKSFDGIEAIEISEIPDPVAGANEVVVQVEAAALNFFDILMTRDKYQYKPGLPYSPCAEIAGTVLSIGDGVSDFAAGDRVAAYIGWGGARQKVVVATHKLIPVPAEVGFDVAAGVSVTYGTAIHGLKDRGQLQPGETLAVLGASGGAGMAAIEIGKRLGARVIAVASSAEKLEACRSIGADETIDYSKEDLKDSLKNLTGGAGVDVVYDCVGGKSSEPAVRATAWGGRFLVVGFAAGEIPRIPLNLLLLKGCSLVGVFWGEFLDRHPERHRQNTANVLNWCASGDLNPHIHGRYPLAQTIDALRLIEERRVRGKIIILPNA